MENITENPSILDNKTCKFIKSDGKKCGALKMKNSDYCFFHNPECETERLESKRSGGKRKIYIIKSENVISQRVKFPLTKPKDVTRFLSDLIENTISGEIDVRISSSIAYLCSTLLKSMELSEIQNKINDLENLLSEKLNNNGNE